MITAIEGVIKKGNVKEEILVQLAKKNKEGKE